MHFFGFEMKILFFSLIFQFKFSRSFCEYVARSLSHSLFNFNIFFYICIASHQEQINDEEDDEAVVVDEQQKKMDHTYTHT